MNHSARGQQLPPYRNQPGYTQIAWLWHFCVLESPRCHLRPSTLRCLVDLHRPLSQTRHTSHLYLPHAHKFYCACVVRSSSLITRLERINLPIEKRLRTESALHTHRNHHDTISREYIHIMNLYSKTSTTLCTCILFHS